MSASRYAPAALASATAFVRAVASDDAAELLSLIVGARAEGTRSRLASRDLFDGTRFAFEECEEPRRLGDACRDFEIGLGVKAGGLASSDDVATSSPVFLVSERLIEILDGPFPPVSGRDLPVPDVASAVWIETIRTVVAAGRGAHLALRCDRNGGDVEIADFAALVGADGTTATLAAGPDLARVILRSELHAGEAPGVVGVTDLKLVAVGAESVDEPGASWSVTEPVLTAAAEEPVMRRAMGAVRNVYVWRLEDGRLPSGLVGLIAGVIGPLGADPAWCRFVIGASAPEAGPFGVDAILGVVGDPRRADALVHVTRAVAAVTGAPFDDGASFVARSFGGRRFGGRSGAAAPPTSFDPRLVVADHDAPALLDAAPRLRAEGCRILFAGPPGGGKSALAAELCRRMAAAPSGGRLCGEAPVLLATAADLLVREYGGTERLLATLFDGAATAGGVGGGAPILVDELDSFCAVRQPGATGGNAYLVRSLTNEWLRALDSHPAVPVVAICNDTQSIDPAVLRRFALVVSVEADLPPELEHLAWRSILGVEPPINWSPVGAAVSDVVGARSRCAALGETTSATLATAIARLRDARTGPPPRATSRRRSVH